jgi:hypothetical protein
MPVTVYGRTKALAEVEVHKAIERGLDAVIVHPSAVIGPYDFKPSFLGQAFIDFAHGDLPAFTGGCFDLVDVRDLAQGILAAAERGKRGEHYMLSGSLVEFTALGEILERCTGRKRPRFVVPLWLAGMAGVFMPLYYRATGKQPRFTRMSLRMLGDGRQVSREKAGQELGYAPRPPEEGVRAAVDWFQDTGMIHPVHRSRRDTAILIMVGAVLLVCLAGGFMLLLGGTGLDWLLGLVGMLFSGAYLWLTVPVRYALQPGQLLVRGGPFRWKIPYASIQRVSPSRNPVSAPAWSWKRLRIQYQKDGRSVFVLVSPKDREGFLQQLAESAPELELEGERIVRHTTPPQPDPGPIDPEAPQ